MSRSAAQKTAIAITKKKSRKYNKEKKDSTRPKKRNGKKPKNCDRLYTDENPKDTVI